MLVEGQGDAVELDCRRRSWSVAGVRAGLE